MLLHRHITNVSMVNVQSFTPLLLYYFFFLLFSFTTELSLFSVLNVSAISQYVYDIIVGTLVHTKLFLLK